MASRGVQVSARAASARLAWARRKQARERERDEVEATAPEFMALWDAEGKRFASAEAFLEYAYANGSEVEAAVEALAERRLRAEFAALGERCIDLDVDSSDVEMLTDVELAWEAEELVLGWRAA